MGNQNQNQNLKKNEDYFSVKETTPNISAGRVISGDRLPTAFDLVEQMQFLFARVVRAKDLPETCNPYVEVKLGTFVGQTKTLEKTTSPEWNQVFAFSKDRIQEPLLEIVVRDKENIESDVIMCRVASTVCEENDDPDEIIGSVVFTVYDVPTRVPPDSPLAPEWYKLGDQNGVKKLQGELMVSVWIGTQADEGFPEAWHSDATEASGENIAHTRSKVYISPKFWYLRVNVIQAQDLLVKNKGGGGGGGGNNNQDIFIQGVLGNLVLRSRPIKINANPIWNEDLMFVAAEPFDEPLQVSIEQGNFNKHECLGSCMVSLKNVEKRIVATPAPCVWYNLNLQTHKNNEEEVKISSKLHMRISLDGGYHVLDEATNYSSDLRPSSRYLCKPSIGVLELGIHSAMELSPMKKENRTDAFCVAKYGPKWVRTRTIVDSLSPKWNEQYTWEVYDPCTVITIAVFDNGNLHKKSGGRNAEMGVDKRIGKVRIRLSTLESDRIYTHSYPLINLQPPKAKKVGEIQLAVRFSCPSLLNVLQTYAQPLLPAMHYVCPLSIFQLESLRDQAAAINTLRFRRAEPPLSKEVVEYMLDTKQNLWSMRKGRAQFFRIAGLLNGLVLAGKKFEEIRIWKSTITTVFSYFIFLCVVFFPRTILPSTFTYFFLVGLWRYRTRPRYPSHMDMTLSQVENAHPEELEEEFDPVPSKFNGENLRKRYDRLRGICGRVLSVMSDLATQGERLQSLLSWRDPRATVLFILFSLVAIFVTYFVPFRFIVLIWVTYLLRPPRFRCFDIPAVPHNFLRRMPAKSDCML
ncbi:hypothetical protein RJT34_28028 [Clitoria ternatea]|uniref:C2 domain-containing protein n=1 Tax=Clitoria ternatea TaxID=43366 RepID=A0AAN9FAG2_CLITE